MAPLLPKIRGQFAEFLWRHPLAAWVCSTSPLVSALVQSTISRARRGRGGRVASWVGPHQSAARLTHRPLSHRCRPRGWVLLRSWGHGATFGPSAGGIEPAFTLLMPALTLRMLAPPFRAGVSLPHVPLPRPRSPAPSVSPLAPLHPRRAGWAQLGWGCGTGGELLRFH